MRLSTSPGAGRPERGLSVSNKQLELMGRYMAELGITPASRSRVAALQTSAQEPLTVMRVLFEGTDGTTRDSDGNVVEDDDTVVRIPPGGRRV